MIVCYDVKTIYDKVDIKPCDGLPHGPKFILAFSSTLMKELGTVLKSQQARAGSEQTEKGAGRLPPPLADGTVGRLAWPGRVRHAYPYRNVPFGPGTLALGCERHGVLGTAAGGTCAGRGRQPDLPWGSVLASPFCIKTIRLQCLFCCVIVCHDVKCRGGPSWQARQAVGTPLWWQRRRGQRDCRAATISRSGSLFDSVRSGQKLRGAVHCFLQASVSCTVHTSSGPPAGPSAEISQSVEMVQKPRIKPCCRDHSCGRTQIPIPATRQRKAVSCAARGLRGKAGFASRVELLRHAETIYSLAVWVKCIFFCVAASCAAARRPRSLRAARRLEDLEFCFYSGTSLLRRVRHPKARRLIAMHDKEITIRSLLALPIHIKSKSPFRYHFQGLVVSGSGNQKIVFRAFEFHCIPCVAFCMFSVRTERHQVEL